MQKTKSDVIADRAWNILRLALLWASKGGVFKRRLIMDLPKYIKSLRHTTKRRGALLYGERQFSFDDTPIIHIKMHRPSSLRFRFPRIPCLNSQVDFDYDFEDNDDDDGFYYNDGARKSDFIKGEDCDDMDEGIDVKAEEFIAKFYEQMKMQRQISYPR